MVKLHKDFEVYVDKSAYTCAVGGKTCKSYVSQIVDKVYTTIALQSATPKGFPPRGKGKKKIRDKPVMPQLHPHGIKAIVGELTFC